MTDPTTFVGALRHLIRVARVTELDDVPDLGQLTDLVGTIRNALEPHMVDEVPMQAGLDASRRRGRPGHLPELAGVTPEDFFAYSPIIGPLNPVAPDIRLWVDGGEVHGAGRFGPQHCGPPAGVHGGHVAALLDEVLGLTCLANATGGFTGTLTVRYEALTPVDEQLVVRGWIERVDGRKTIARGEVRYRDTVCARAEGLFISSREDGAQALPGGRSGGGAGAAGS